ncbi:hypothetical protein JL720_1516 [Aureococcus anophagefferens]|nr:hypothetical protein JL720_1516 [Aureococcus anophagefferens]
MPTPQRNKKKQAKPSTPGTPPTPSRRPSTPTTRPPRAASGARRRAAALDRHQGRGADVLNSVAAFAGRVPVLERCVWDERKLGALHSLKDGLAKQLAVDHRRETQRLASHLRNATLPELNRAADDCLKAVEDGCALLDRDGWDPATPAGRAGVAAELFVDAAAQRDALRRALAQGDALDNALRAVWHEDDDDDAATTRSAAALARAPRSFIDNGLDVVFTNHDLI